MDETIKRLIELERICSIYETKIAFLDDFLSQIEIGNAKEYVKDCRDGKSYASYKPKIDVDTVRMIMGLNESAEARELLDSLITENRADKPLVMPTIEA